VERVVRGSFNLIFYVRAKRLILQQGMLLPLLESSGVAWKLNKVHGSPSKDIVNGDGRYE
jgi:hypothetical protein